MTSRILFRHDHKSCMTELLPNLTDITTTRDVDTPYGAIPAGTAGTIVSDYDHAAYLVEFEAPWYVVTVPHDLVLPDGR